MQLTDLSLNRNLYKTLQDISTQGADQLASNVAPMPSNAVASGNTVVDINTNAQLINGAQLEPGTYPVTTLDIANWGWNQTCNFSVTDDNTISWASGSFISADGTAYSISGGDTGNMAAKTYVYLDINVSTTAYQITTNVNTVVGIGKVMIAVCQNTASVGTGATVNLVQASQITADNILANSINANKITAGSITTTQLSATAIDAMTITGALIRTAATGARLEMDGYTNYFKAYDTTGTQIMSLGAPSGNSVLRITPNATTYEGIFITQNVASASARGILLERTSGATGPSLYVLSWSGSSGDVIDIVNDGSGEAISIAANGAGKAIDITSFSSGSNPAIGINNTGTQPSISLTNSNTATNNAAFYITKTGAGTNIELNANCNSSNATYGITFDLNNSGSGLEHAFRFTGSEYVTSAVGGSQDRKIRVIVGATVYYIPCYTA